MSTTLEQLVHRLDELPNPPQVYLRIQTPEDADNLETVLERAGYFVRHIRGDKMRNEHALFDEISAALQFPAYFGSNSAALDECWSDLSWLPLTRRGIVLAIRHPADILVEEDKDALEWFVRRIRYVQEDWIRTSEAGEGRDRLPKAFHFLMQASPGTFPPDERWEAAGARLTVV